MIGESAIQTLKSNGSCFVVIYVIKQKNKDGFVFKKIHFNCTFATGLIPSQWEI